MVDQTANRNRVYEVASRIAPIEMMHDKSFDGAATIPSGVWKCCGSRLPVKKGIVLSN